MLCMPSSIALRTVMTNIYVHRRIGRRLYREGGKHRDTASEINHHGLRNDYPTCVILL